LNSSGITPDNTQTPKKDQTLVVALSSQCKAFFKAPTQGHKGFKLARSYSLTFTTLCNLERTWFSEISH